MSASEQVTVEAAEAAYAATDAAFLAGVRSRAGAERLTELAASAAAAASDYNATDPQIAGDTP